MKDQNPNLICFHKLNLDISCQDPLGICDCECMTVQIDVQTIHKPVSDIDTIPDPDPDNLGTRSVRVSVPTSGVALGCLLSVLPILQQVLILWPLCMCTLSTLFLVKSFSQSSHQVMSVFFMYKKHFLWLAVYMWGMTSEKIFSVIQKWIIYIFRYKWWNRL